MTSLRHKLFDPTRDEGCILLIAADEDEAARVLGELSSETEERFRVEWVTEIDHGIERLRDGCVEATVLDLNLPGSQVAEIFDELFQAASKVPILILTEADTETMARRAIDRGAYDYLLKTHTDGYRLRRAVRSMIQFRMARTMAVEHEIAITTLNSIGEAVLRTDKNGKVSYLNLYAETMTGWSGDEANGCPVGDVLRIIDSVESWAGAKDVAKATREDRTAKNIPCVIHGTLVRRDGVEFGVENRITTATDPAGEFVGTVIAIRDVSTARAASLEISRIAQYDDLTNLPNRSLFNDRLRQAIALAERQRKQLAILFVDLDHFKQINDSLGHAIGDKLLRSVAGRLVACVRRSDTVCRLGGDEFVILLSQVEHAEDAEICARKILRAVTASHVIDNKSLDVSISIGGSIYPGDAMDAETLTTYADAAMYEAKSLGRNGYHFFRSDMQVREAKRLLLEKDLRYALGRDEFLLHYQPKIDLKTGKITGMEALIRWQHPEQGLLFPASFIPIAEECGLIVPIGQWVLLRACRQSQEWRDSGMACVPIAVNVSAAEFRAKDFLSGVRAVLISTGVEPVNLEFELTESVLMQDTQSAVITLHALKEMGVRLAIDDFGTGFSSFTYLRRFPMDALKVDKSFIQEITPNSEDPTFVVAMINIGKSLNQRVIAEGVETSSQLKFLQRHGCSEGQGYYFSRPLAAEQAVKLFETGLACGNFRDPTIPS
jgi:diguanylate cyclase (GGDEF)-like protein/PAS domain S-box-containing protein